MTRSTRRNLLKGLAISAPAAWTAPFVKSVILPAHAQTSCTPTLSCSTNDPTNISPPSPTDLIGAGTAWGWDNGTGDPEDSYSAEICGLEAHACPGTDVTIGLVSIDVPSGNVTVGSGNSNPLTVQANASGVASFSECVVINLAGGTAHFTLRFSSDDGSGPCDIPFCFTEYDPATSCGAVMM